MLTALLLLLLQTDVRGLDFMAQRRDVAGLTRKLAPLPSGVRNPFGVLRTNGAYETGRYGWHALEGRTPDGSDTFVVFSTPLTSEDVGELVFQREGQHLRYIPEAEPLGMRVVRHDLDVVFLPKEKRVTLIDRMSLQKTNATRPYFVFRLSPSYRVNSVEEGTNKVAFTQVGGTVIVPTPNSELATYIVRYESSPNLREYAGSIEESEASLTNDYWYPMIARQPAPYSIRVTAPKNWTVVAQGEPVSQSRNDETVVVQYRMDLPVIFYSLSAGPYRSTSKDVNGKRYTVWGANLTESQMSDQLELLPPIVEFYERKFGYWPFKRFGMLQSPAYGFGALEAYSYATYGGGLPEEDPHEPAHTLFGGALNNSYLKSFWNESFAAFCEGFYRREMALGNSAERRLAFIQTPETSPDYNQAPLADAGADIGGAASALGYGKGGFVIQMLEQLVGTERFVRAVARWIKERPLDRSVEWADFERVMVTEATSLPIERFFDDWVEKPGVANFEVGEFRMDGEELRFTLEFRGRSYTLPLEVMFVSPDGKREVQTTVLSGSNRRAQISLRPSFRPSLVSIDPWRRLLRPISDNETPVQLDETLRRARTFVDPARSGFLNAIPKPRRLSELPENLDGTFVVGHPDTLPVMRPLCEKVGFKVEGDMLTFGGSTVDLKDHAALAVVDLANGGHCVIGLGNVRLEPKIGRARLAITDSLGRFLRGVSEPKTKGALTFRL